MQNRQNTWRQTQDCKEFYMDLNPLEKIQISRFNVEYQKEKGQIVKNVQVLDNIPEYVYKKVYLKYCQGLNYIHEKASTKSW